MRTRARSGHPERDGRLVGLVAAAVIMAATAFVPAASAATSVQLVSPSVSAFDANPRVGTQTKGATRSIVGIVDLQATGGGLLCGTCEGEFGFYNLRIGGRVHAWLVRAPARCPSAPGGGRTVLGGGSRPFVDVSAGRYRVMGQLRATSLRRGTWRLCTWFQIDPSFPVSNPVFPGGLPGFSVPTQTEGPFISAKAVRVS